MKISVGPIVPEIFVESGEGRWGNEKIKVISNFDQVHYTYIGETYQGMKCVWLYDTNG